MDRKLLKIGAVGFVVTVLCCFTPLLVVLFAALGLAAWVGYLDIMLFPLLGLFMLLIMVSLFKKKRDV